MPFKSIDQVLITGCYRSGSEYFTQLLNNHPSLSATMYTTNFMRRYYNRYNPIEQEYPKLINDVSEYISKRWNKEIDAKEMIGYFKYQKSVTYGDLYDAIMSSLYLKGKKRRWADKTQLVWREIPTFLDMFPLGKSIVIIRDPRSVLASFKKYTNAPGQLYLEAIFNCLDVMEHVVKYQKKCGNRFMCIRYEDLINEPFSTMISVFKFLGLSHTHDLLCENDWVNTNGTLWNHNSAFTEKDKKFSKKDALSRWKTLEDWEIALCENVNHKMMDIFGYEKENLLDVWTSEITEPRIKALFTLWLRTGKGIQQFPTDPDDEKNWDKLV